MKEGRDEMEAPFVSGKCGGIQRKRRQNLGQIDGRGRDHGEVRICEG
jgi:hypothetical protein